MTKFCTAFLLVVISFSNSADAQLSRGLVKLTTYKAVQAELGISDETVSKLNALNEEFQKALVETSRAEGLPRGMPLPTNEQYESVLAKRVEVTAKVESAFMPKLKQLLSDQQIKRLKQIQIQELTSHALRQSDIADALTLTDEQRKALATLRADFLVEWRAAFQSRDAARIDRVGELMKMADADAFGILTAEQTAKFDEMKGVPFDLSQLSSLPGSSQRKSEAKR